MYLLIFFIERIFHVFVRQSNDYVAKILFFFFISKIFQKKIDVYLFSFKNQPDCKLCLKHFDYICLDWNIENNPMITKPHRIFRRITNFVWLHSTMSIVVSNPCQSRHTYLKSHHKIPTTYNKQSQVMIVTLCIATVNWFEIN